MSNLKKGEVKVSSHGRKYEVVSGPHEDNAGKRYLVLDEADGILRLESEGILEAMDGDKKDEKF